MLRRIQRSRQRSPYRPIVLAEEATRQQIAFIESHRIEFPELDLVSVQRRLYLSDGFAAHLLGYLGEVSQADLDRPELALMHPGDLVGKAGIERQYDEILRGKDGLRRVIVDSHGRETTVLDEELPTSGKPLRLTIDYDLQLIAEQELGAEQGALVALDPRTGEVLAMVSHPGFDLNLFSGGISTQDWSGLVSDPALPLLNRAIQAQLAPGSIYKVVLAAASMEAESADETTSYYCGGGAVFYDRYFRCWKKGGHGRVNLHQALVHSCDVFFYNLGKNLGVERIAEYSFKYGLGRKTGIDLPNEETGTVPSPEWKEKLFRQKWYAGETISLAIGQGALTVTPLQVAYSVGGITSGGHFARPHLAFWHDVESAGLPVQAPQAIRVAMDERTVAAVTDALYGVVNEGGTGTRARVAGLDIGGKTGTAQVASLERTRAAGQSTKDLRDNAWFVGLAPRRNPEIVVAVLYQSGEHGYLAAPIARDIIKAYFDKKNGIQPHLAQKTESGREAAAVKPVASPTG